MKLVRNRRRLPALALAAALLLAPMATANATDKVTSALYTTGTALQGVIDAGIEVNVRSGPGTDYEKIIALEPGTTFKISGEENGWYKIKYGEVEGYVSKDFVKTSEYADEVGVDDVLPVSQTANAGEGDNTDAQDSAGDGFVYITAQRGTVEAAATVNIREKADVESERVGSIEPGKTCEVLGSKDGWYEVEYEGVTGYIREDFLKVFDYQKKVTEEEAAAFANAGTQVIDSTTGQPLGNTDAQDSVGGGTGKYVTVTETQGTVTAGAKVNVRSGPSTDYDIVGTIDPDDTCTVLETSGDWYKISYSGGEGYMSSQFLKTEEVQRQVEIIEEDPLEASLNGLVSPTLVDGADFDIQGVITSNIPIVSVSVSVRNQSSLAIELTAKKTYERSANMREFNLTALNEDMRFDRLSGGEKLLTITVTSANETKALVEKCFSVIGEVNEPIHMTKECSITVAHGKASSMTDGNLGTTWAPNTEDELVTVIIPDGRDAGSVCIKWKKPESGYVITCKDIGGSVLETITPQSGYTPVNAYHELAEGTRVVEIKCGNLLSEICELRVYERDNVAPDVAKWEPLSDKVDVLFISAHQDDELLFFGGGIPYSVAEGKEVAVAYMANCSRGRYEEAMRGLWTAGMTKHPIFLGLTDKNTDTYEEADALWGYEETIGTIVSLIRQYKPDVIVTHDINGEYGHNQHKLTSAIVRRAVLLCNDAGAYPDSASMYGTWEVKKLYIHLYEGNSITMDWNKPLDYFDGRTALEMATAAYDKHASQHGYYTMTGAGVTYDNSKFGLIVTTVGYDSAMNSFFENIE